MPVVEGSWSKLVGVPLIMMSAISASCATKPVQQDPAKAQQAQEEAMQAIRESLDRIENDPAFADVSDYRGFTIDLRYATTNNFMKKDMYGPFQRCYLHREAADKLKKAIVLLQKKHPGYKLHAFDCMRPRSVQRVLWAGVVGTPQEKYVANPDQGSMHNYGFAIDLTVEDEKGQELDMGTHYDFFGPQAEPQLEEKFLKSGELTPKQIANRKILRSAMTGAGFIQLPHEWWHYDGRPKAEVKANYKIVE